MRNQSLSKRSNSEYINMISEFVCDRHQNENFHQASLHVINNSFASAPCLSNSSITSQDKLSVSKGTVQLTEKLV